MKVIDLKNHIDSQLKVMPRYADWEVVIPVSEPSMGAIAATKTTGAGFGFDWNHGRFFIHPETPLVRKSKQPKELK